MEYLVLWVIVGLVACLVCNHKYYTYMNRTFDGMYSNFWYMMFKTVIVATIPPFMLLGPFGFIMYPVLVFAICKD